MMGEAKRRGTYEQRLELALKRRAEKTRKALVDRMARDAALTPQQRQDRHAQKLRLVALESLAMKRSE